MTTPRDQEIQRRTELSVTRVTKAVFPSTTNHHNTLFGGTAPLVATWLISQTGSSLAPAFYLVVIALVALVGGLALPETSRISLHEDAGERQPARAIP